MAIAEMSAAFGGAKASLDLLRAAKGTMDQAVIASAIADIQSKLLDAQSAALRLLEENTAMSNENRTLAEQLRSQEDWKQIEEKYVLRHVGSPGIQAWVETGTESGYSSAVKLCTGCFAKHVRSPLQHVEVRTSTGSSSGDALLCPTCNVKLQFHGTYMA